MYQIKWNEIVPQLLPKIIDRRLVRAHGSYFDCRFTLDFDDNSCIQFQCDDVIHRNAIEFEIILNRHKIYNPLHFDSTDIFTNNLGQITDSKEYRTPKRNNVREIFVFFDAKKKFFKLSQQIFNATRFNKYKLNESVSDEICSFLQPRYDKMIIRTYRKSWHDLKKYEPKGIKKVEKHQELVKKLYSEDMARNNDEQEINYDDSVFELYPIGSNKLTLQQTRDSTRNTNNDSNDGHNNDDEYVKEAKKEMAKSLYPISTHNDDDNDDDGDNGENMDIEMKEKYKEKEEEIINNIGKKKDYDKIYCDVVCRISSWNTFTTTAKKKKY